MNVVEIRCLPLLPSTDSSMPVPCVNMTASVAALRPRRAHCARLLCSLRVLHLVPSPCEKLFHHVPPVPLVSPIARTGA